MNRRNGVPFETLHGKTITAIDGAEEGSEATVFTCGDGSSYRMYHIQECCENVRLEEVVGDPKALVGQKVLAAFESTNRDEISSRRGEIPRPSPWSESWTWTFYTIRTMTCTVVFRWLGESSGNYSESVYFRQVTPPVAHRIKENVR